MFHGDRADLDLEQLVNDAEGGITVSPCRHEESKRKQVVSFLSNSRSLPRIFKRTPAVCFTLCIIPAQGIPRCSSASTITPRCRCAQRPHVARSSSMRTVRSAKASGSKLKGSVLHACLEVVQYEPVGFLGVDTRNRTRQLVGRGVARSGGIQPFAQCLQSHVHRGTHPILADILCACLGRRPVRCVATRALGHRRPGFPLGPHQAIGRASYLPGHIREPPGEPADFPGATRIYGTPVAPFHFPNACGGVTDCQPVTAAVQPLTDMV